MNKLAAYLLLALAVSSPERALAEGITLQQPDGTELRLEQPAERLITLSPHLAELVFAAGAGDTLLATVEFSTYPDAAAALPRVGDAFRLDLESIVTLDPDLVIAWASGNTAARSPSTTRRPPSARSGRLGCRSGPWKFGNRDRSAAR